MTTEVEHLLGRILIAALRSRGYVVVPMLPPQEMIQAAERSQTGTFSNWNFIALWLSVLAIADPDAKPHLDRIAAEHEIKPRSLS